MNSPLIPDTVRQLGGPLQRGSDSGHAAVGANTPGPDSVTPLMPKVMRIESIDSYVFPDGAIYYRSVLFHQRCKVSVDWWAQDPDEQLLRNCLVSVCHATTPNSVNGAIRVDGIVPAIQPLPSFNIFETVPSSWISDRTVVARAVHLWEQLPESLAHLINAVLWDNDRFQRFVMGPSSLRDHHPDWNGNFHHSVEVAEHARNIGQRVPLANEALLIAAGLLHDSAKADEYRYDRVRRAFCLSERGELIGHRDTLIEWLAAARESTPVTIADDTYLSLLHIINASKGPAWMGLRDPRCIEADILSMADRISSSEDIYSRSCPKQGQAGFGSYNRHTGRRSYVTRRL